MSKGTIIYIGGFRLPDGNAAAQRVTGIGMLLREIHYNVVFIDVSDDCSNEILQTKRNINGFDCWSVCYPRTTATWLKYITNISNVVKIEKRYEDICAVIAYNYPAVALARLNKHCRKRGYKLIADCTEWYPKTKNIVKNMDSDLRMRKIQPVLDGVITISRFLDEYYRKKTKTVYLPPLVDCKDSKWNLDKIGHDELCFTYAGNPGKHKDKLNLIIEVLYEISPDKRYSFNIIGITKEQYLNYYPEHAHILSVLNEKISFKGRVAHREALGYVKSADFSIFFRPDTLVSKAGFPTKFVEAVTCGTPVFTNNTSDLCEYIKDGENAVLIDGYEKDDIRNALERVFMLDRKELLAMSEMCSKWKCIFDYRNYKTQMEGFFKEVFNGNENITS